MKLKINEESLMQKKFFKNFNKEDNSYRLNTLGIIENFKSRVEREIQLSADSTIENSIFENAKLFIRVADTSSLKCAGFKNVTFKNCEFYFYEKVSDLIDFKLQQRLFLNINMENVTFEKNSIYSMSVSNSSIIKNVVFLDNKIDTLSLSSPAASGISFLNNEIRFLKGELENLPKNGIQFLKNKIKMIDLLIGTNKESLNKNSDIFDGYVEFSKATKEKKIKYYLSNKFFDIDIDEINKLNPNFRTQYGKIEIELLSYKINIIKSNVNFSNDKIFIEANEFKIKNFDKLSDEAKKFIKSFKIKNGIFNCHLDSSFRGIIFFDINADKQRETLDRLIFLGDEILSELDYYS